MHSCRIGGSRTPKNPWEEDCTLSTDRKAKSQITGYVYQRFEKRAWDFRTENIGQ
jgi:hypothetical protein